MSNQPKIGTVIFENVSKRYQLGVLGTLRGTVSALLSSRQRREDRAQRTLWALHNVSFRAEPGSSLGLIGPNGAGKTTTLKLLANITKPAAGRVVVHGRVSSLIELGAGFHPELTGRDNIFLNGAILGLGRNDIARKLDSIIAFSELERFIDTPVKRYSSGMYVRLGFAVAAHAEPDILLVDEVLAVGDSRFRTRCMQRIHELQKSGTTILFVSHNMHQVRQVCDSAILLIGGQVREYGTPAAVIATYERLLASSSIEETSHRRPGNATQTQTSGLLVKAVDVLASHGDARDYLASHEPAIVKITYHAVLPIQVGRVHVATYQSDGTLCSVADSARVINSSFELRELAGEGEIEITYNPLQLATGTYYVTVQITDSSDAEVIASRQSQTFNVVVEESPGLDGIFVPTVNWSQYSIPAKLFHTNNVVTVRDIHD